MTLITDFTAMEAQIRKEDKCGLGYILGHLDHNDMRNIYWDSTLKKVLLERVLSQKDRWYKIRNFTTYKQFFTTI